MRLRRSVRVTVWGYLRYTEARRAGRDKIVDLKNIVIIRLQLIALPQLKKPCRKYTNKMIFNEWQKIYHRDLIIIYTKIIDNMKKRKILYREFNYMEFCKLIYRKSSITE